MVYIPISGISLYYSHISVNEMSLENNRNSIIYPKLSLSAYPGGELSSKLRWKLTLQFRNNKQG